MAIGAITSAGEAAGSAASLGLQDFMKILLTQLTYQDPLKPMDNQEFMAQMAQFTSVELTLRLNDRVLQLVENQAALQSVGLIGRTVEIATATGTATGTVSALSLQGDAPLISVTVSGGTVLRDIRLGQVLAVR